MNKIERNEMIIKNVQMDKTQNEIANELGCSIRTVRRVIEEHFGSTTRVKSPSGQNGFYITEEMWESLQDKIDSLLDTIDIQSAKIQSLEADVIKASTVHCNELKSDKKYIIKRLSTREVIDYSNEDELGRYIKIFGSRIPVSTIDNSIRDNGKWMCRPDDIEITYTAEAAFNDINYKSQMLSDQHNDLANKINNIMEEK